MVVYEVTISNAAGAVWPEFLIWLRKHIKDMEALPGFLPHSKVYNVEGETDSVCVQYALESSEALENYFNVHAEEMRGDLDDSVKANLEFSRRVLIPKSWD
jgi:hypothetical protein